ncbi:MAG: hypothetical protein Ta2B_15350 [Termitinemataceae bacterium]|nr:MAG: hypothetical protein Ta2B_15350 [Termitinemataceae bacterium]
MKTTKKVFFIVLATVVAGSFMGCATSPGIPLTTTDWLNVPANQPTTTIEVGGYSARMLEGKGSFGIKSIGGVNIPKPKKKFWSPVTVPANQKLDIYGSFFVRVGYYIWDGQATFKCPELSANKSYKLAATFVGGLSPLYGWRKHGLSFMLFERESSDKSWVPILQQLISKDGDNGGQFTPKY